MAVQFGKSGCSDISVEPFTPICSFDEPKGTTPLSFDVPAVSIAMPVPPAECTCFDFAGSSQTVSVGVAPCGEEGASTFTTTIEKASDDCCDGQYAVKTTGSVSVPCMPFDVEGSTVKVKSKSGKTDAGDIDGSIDFWVKKGDGSSCCSLTSGIDVTLPDCIKSYTKPVDPQITYYEKGDQKTHKLIDIAEDKTNCSIYPTVKPITLPACSLADEQKTAKFKVNDTEYSMTLMRKNCAYDIAMPDITVNVPDVVVPNICFGSATFKYTYTYTDETGNAQTKAADSQSASGSFTRDGNDCWSLAVSGLSFDLGSIGGSDFDDTGDVFEKTYTEGDVTGTRLVINGDTHESDPWYLGGIGTAAGKGTANGWIDLGTLKGAESGTYTGTIPLAKQDHAHYMAKTTTTTTQAWRSARKGTCASAWNAPLINFETGDLSAIMMTGAEWSSRGVALRTSNFFYNSSGVLSFVVEAPFDTTHDDNGVYALQTNMSYAPVVAPGIAVATYNKAEKNASGLVVNALADLTESGLATGVQGLTSGLAVNPGKGLRIHGVTGMASETDSSKKDSVTASDLGKLELLTRSDDFAFTKDGRLGFNDAKASTQTLAMQQDKDKDNAYTFTEFNRGNDSEYVIPLFVPTQFIIAGWLQPLDSKSMTVMKGFCDCDSGDNDCRATCAACLTNGKYDARLCSTDTLDMIRTGIAVVYLHVSKSGVILGITKTATQLDNTTGRPTAKAATQTLSSSS